MENINILMIISIVSLIFAVISLILVLITAIKVVGMEKSTHTITYQPVDDEIEKANQEIMEKWSRQGQSEIALDQKQFKEDLEDNFPEFLTEEENDGAISF